MATETQVRKSELLTPESRARIDAWIAKYPADQKQSAVLSALQTAQEQNGGWVSRELLDAVADYLDMPPVLVYEVGTYTSKTNSASSWAKPLRTAGSRSSWKRNVWPPVPAGR
jgi:NADH-quinone oxidoreductase subunit E